MQSVELRDFLDFSFLSALEVEDGTAYFIRSRCSEADNGYRSDLWALDLATGRTRQLTNTGRVRSFLSLGGGQILYPHSQSGKFLSPSTEYRIARPGGGEPRPLFTVPLLAEDIRRVRGDLYVVLAKTSLTAPEDLPESGGNWVVFDELPFAENGKGYVGGIRHRLYLFDANSGEVVPITGKRFQVRNDFAVSEGGRFIAYMGMEIDNKETSKLGIFVYDTITGGTRQLLPLDRYKLRNLDFLGEKVLFTGADGSRYVWSQNAWFYTLDPRTGEEETFFRSFQMPVNNSIGSDCRYGGGRLWRITPEGQVYHVITQEGSARIVRIEKDGPEVMITQKTGSVDAIALWEGKLYMIAMRDLRLQEIYELDPATGKERRLTSFNEDFHETHSLAVPLPCDFINAAGDAVQGWVIPPVGYIPGKKYPAILDIHGGPKTAYGDVYYHEMQLWASRGYFVFYCNPRGSDGMGDEFGFLMTRYGTVDYEDIMAFTDIVLERWPDIDPQRLGVTGGSYGGYMTNWIVGHTHRFAAAASQRSISNWITDEGASDWSYQYSPHRFGGVSARLKLDEAWASSPLKYADYAETPMLFIHSDEDFRCPLGEALQFYTNIINRGVEARLCLFKGENHELSRSGSPKNRVKRLQEITDWMDRHLKA